MAAPAHNQNSQVDFPQHNALVGPEAIQQALEAANDVSRPLADRMQDIVSVAMAGLSVMTDHQREINTLRTRANTQEARANTQEARANGLETTQTRNRDRIRVQDHRIRQISTDNSILRAKEPEKDLEKEIVSSKNLGLAYDALVILGAITIIGIPVSAYVFYPRSVRNHRKAFYAIKEHWVLTHFPESQDSSTSDKSRWVKNKAMQMLNKQLRYFATISKASKNARTESHNSQERRFASYEQLTIDRGNAGYWRNFEQRMTREKENAFTTDIRILDNYLCTHFRPGESRSEFNEVTFSSINGTKIRLNFQSLEELGALEPFPTGRADPIRIHRRPDLGR